MVLGKALWRAASWQLTDVRVLCIRPGGCSDNLHFPTLDMREYSKLRSIVLHLQVEIYCNQTASEF